MNTERGFIAFSEKEKHARMSGVCQGFGMHGHTFLQMDCDSLTALPFFWSVKGQNSFFLRLAAGGPERGRGTGQMGLPINQHLHNSVHLAAETMFLSLQFADQRGNWRGFWRTGVLQEQKGNKHCSGRKQGYVGDILLARGNLGC